jgi:CheW-like domain
MNRDLMDGPQAPGANELRVAFRVHPQLPWLVVRRGVVTQLAVDAPVTRVPNTQPWLAAMMNLRGVLLPVFDLARWLDLPPISGQSLRALVFDATGEAAAVLCHGDPEVRRLNVGHAEWSGDERLLPFLGTRFLDEGESAFEFDHRHWFAEAGLRAAA